MTKTGILIPSMDTVHILFHMCVLKLRRDPDTAFSHAVSSLVYDARNQLAATAIRNGFDRVLWLDSDMTFEPDLLERLSARIDEGYDMVSGLYLRRKHPHTPCIYSRVEPGEHAVPFESYPENEIFEIQGCGFGAVMMKTELLKEVGREFGWPFSPDIGLGEDLTFCKRVQYLGHKVYCDSSVKLGHIGMREYYPGHSDDGE